MCATSVAAAGGFMISAAGNSDRAPGDGPVLGSKAGVFLGLDGCGCIVGASESCQEGLLSVRKESLTPIGEFGL